MAKQTEDLTKAEKLAGVMSGGRGFNRQLAAQLRDELRRLDKSADHAAALLREGADLISTEVDALKSGISINGETKPSPEDAHTVAAIEELEAWIARAGKLIAEIAANEREDC